MASGLLQRKEYELHPEGPVVLTLRDYEGPMPGKFGPQIIWKFDSPEEREDGEIFSIFYWTGTSLSSDPRNKLGKLLTAFGENIETLEVEDLDPDDLVGKKVQAMIVHALDGTNTMRANIDSIVALRARKPRPETAPEGKSVSVAQNAPDSSGDKAAKATPKSEADWGDDD